MLLEIRNQLYKILFNREGDFTIASLYESLPPESSDRVMFKEQEILSGHSVRKHNDAFNKATGRKRALANLLKKMKTDIRFELSKGEKEVIWKTYFDQHPKDMKG